MMNLSRPLTAPRTMVFGAYSPIAVAILHSSSHYMGRTALSTKAVGAIKRLARKAAGAAELVR